MLIGTTFLTPWGWLEVEYDEHYIHRSFFCAQPKISEQAENALTPVICAELANYFKNPHHRFQLALKPVGSPYQLKVWNALLVIPVGRTLSYGELSHSLQSSPRAIGQACKRNPIALFIPCHRVVGKNNYGGFMGRADALQFKIGLLEHERLNQERIEDYVTITI